MDEQLAIDHVVYLDKEADELNKLVNGSKSMIIRGATGRKIPYGRVKNGDNLYFINNNGEGVIRAKATVNNVFHSEKMTPEESLDLVQKNQNKLNLSEIQFKRWAGKRYIVLIEVSKVEAVNPFQIDKSNYGNMDDWLIVGQIELVMK